MAQGRQVKSLRAARNGEITRSRLNTKRSGSSLATFAQRRPCPDVSVTDLKL